MVSWLQMGRIDTFLGALPERMIMIIALGLASLIGWMDHVTGWELSLFVLYAVPILLAVWYGNRVAGGLLAVFCTAVWWWANRDENPYVTIWGYWVAAFSRFVYFCFVVMGAGALKSQLDADKSRIRALERTRELEREIVQVSEHEQLRIGQDLHDGLCQELAAIGCAATMLKEELTSHTQTTAAAAAMEIEGLLKNAVVRARDLARGIFPVQMEASGLVVALEELVQNTRRLHRVNLSIETPRDTTIDDPQVGMHLYRITQEALNNAIKHGRAKDIRVFFRGGPSAFKLEITDDGTGLSAKPKDSGMGLKTMKYRARLIGAELSLAQGPSGGVKVSVIRENRKESQQNI